MVIVIEIVIDPFWWSFFNVD